jgi:hypothetical protein
MIDSWLFWLIIALAALSIGVFLTWLERRSSRKTFLGQPSKYPSELVCELRGYFRTQDKIESAYLAQIFNGMKDEAPHPVVAIETSEDFDRIQRECGKIAGKVLGENESVDFIPLGKDKVSEYLTKQTQPFYKR